MKIVAPLSALVLAGSAPTVSGKNSRKMKVKAMPDTGRDWVTLPNGVQFQPAGDFDEHHPLVQNQVKRQLRSSGRHLENKWDEFTGSFRNGGNEVGTYDPYATIFVDGGNTIYDDYAQAWRALGWYIDCDYCIGENGQNCWENLAYNNNSQNGQQGNSQTGCQRILLWAAYVDTEYEGNGMSEYMYYNRHTWRWDRSACTAGNSTRCVKMDCHEPDTHYSLLGFFKEPNWGDWIDTVAKNQGDCIWTDEEYRLMRKSRSYFPTNGCTRTPFESENGETLYIDLKPEDYGSMSIGFYTDHECIVDYTSPEDSDGNVLLSTEAVIKDMVCYGYIEMEQEEVAKWGCNNAQNYNNAENEAGSDSTSVRSYTLEQEVQAYNKAFDELKLCQPCKAYDLTGIVAGGQHYERSDNRYYDEDGQTMEYVFNCQNKNSYYYRSLNQCMLFRQYTSMLTATFKDVDLAGVQGSIAGIKVNQISYGTTDRARMFSNVASALSWLSLFFCFVMFLISCSFFMQARSRKRRAENERLKEPLVTQENR